MTLEHLWTCLAKKGIDTDQLWAGVQNVVVRSLVAAQADVVAHPSSFELFGYDVMFDDALRPWLIEVNASPSLARHTDLDMRVKTQLVVDIVDIVDPTPFDRAALLEIAKRRLVDERTYKKRPFAAPSAVAKRVALLEDLQRILSDRCRRPVGVMPERCGDFERVCPGTPAADAALALKKKYLQKKSAKRAPAK
jgi:tubulin polyglutamylase TTLL5|tara:strand:- start:129 stop:710 length:582 start_codon:yes stop_codon:yes gene_type:complete